MDFSVSNKNRAANQPNHSENTTSNSKGRTPRRYHKEMWTAEEDNLLIQLVKEYGKKAWAQIAESIPGRSGKQCRQRWIYNLDPTIKKREWTSEEDASLLRHQRELGNRWRKICRYFKGRSENDVKNRYNCLCNRKQQALELSKQPVPLIQSTVFLEPQNLPCNSHDCQENTGSIAIPSFSPAFYSSSPSLPTNKDSPAKVSIPEQSFSISQDLLSPSSIPLYLPINDDKQSLSAELVPSLSDKGEGESGKDLQLYPLL